VDVALIQNSDMNGCLTLAAQALSAQGMLELDS
jgi:hypothetical protein